MASTVAVTGAWTLQSTNSALEGRLHDGVFLAQANPINASATPNVTWRSGVLSTTSTGGNSIDLLVIPNSTPNMSVRVYPGNWVVTRSGQGPYVGFSAGLVTLTITPADATNPRIDLVYAQVLDGALGDSSTQALIGVVTGTPGASPQVPTLPANSIPLARVAVAANDTSITSGEITDVRKSTAPIGATRMLLPGDSTTDPGFMPGEQRMWISSGAVRPPEYWGADNKWHGAQPITYTRPALNAGLTHLGGAATFTLASLSIPDPGWAYHIEVSASCLVRMDNFAGTYMTGIYTQINIDSALFNPPNPATQQILRTVWTASEAPQQLVTPTARLKSGTPLTGTHTVYYILRNDSSPSNFLAVEDNEYYSFNVKAIPA